MVETNNISCQTKGLSFIQIGSLKPAILYEHRLPSSVKQEGFFQVSISDKVTVNMTSCSEAKEELDGEDGRQESSLGEIDKTLAALEAILARLNWGQIFSLCDETRQHMVVALAHPNSLLTRSIGPSSEKMVNFQLAR